MWSSSGESGERPEIALDLPGKRGGRKNAMALILQVAVNYTVRHNLDEKVRVGSIFKKSVLQSFRVKMK